MPRSQQISTMTAPIGRRRTSSAISSSVGRRARRWSCRVGGLDVPRRGLPCGARHAYGGQADGRNREVPAALGAFAELGFQHRGPAQATGDAGEDDGDIGGAERSDEEGEAWGAGALLHRGGELFAIVDQLANEVEDAAEAAGHVGAGPGRIGLRGWGGEFEGGGHERNKNTKRRGCQGKYSWPSLPFRPWRNCARVCVAAVLRIRCIRRPRCPRRCCRHAPL